MSVTFRVVLVVRRLTININNMWSTTKQRVIDFSLKRKKKKGAEYIPAPRTPKLAKRNRQTTSSPTSQTQRTKNSCVEGFFYTSHVAATDETPDAHLHLIQPPASLLPLARLDAQPRAHHGRRA